MLIQSLAIELGSLVCGMSSDIRALELRNVTEKLGENDWYRVPEFQRGYRWTQQNIIELLEDILMTFEKPELTHFLGTYVVVTSETDSFTGSSKDRSLVIDGQQRLATISIILSVIQDISKAQGWRIHHQLVSRLWADIDENTSCDKIEMGEYDRLLFHAIVREKSKDDMDKIKQYLQTSNRATNAKLSLLVLPDLKNEQNKFNNRLYKAYQIVLREIVLALPPETTSAADWLYKFSKCVLLRITGCKVITKDEATAYEVFESLNARGLGLTPSELLKNHLFSVAKKQGSLDEVRANWRQMENNLPLDDITPFLRHWFVSTTGYVTTKDLYREIKQILEDVSQTAIDLSKRLRDEASTYGNLISPEDHFPKEITQSLLALRDMGVNIVYPLLLSVFCETKGKKIRLKIVSFLEVFCFRFLTICGGRGNELEKALGSWAIKIRSSGDKGALVNEAISDIAKRDQGDDFFYQQLETKSFPTNTSPAFYLLSKIELHVHGGLGALATYSFDRENATVEHIFPKKPSKKAIQYMLSQKVDPDDEDLKGLIGNLTLLCQIQNSDASNGAFPDKMSNYYSRADTELTRIIHDGYSSHPVYDRPQNWNSDEIVKRQKWLMEYAKKNKIWKLS